MYIIRYVWVLCPRYFAILSFSKAAFTSTRYIQKLYKHHFSTLQTVSLILRKYLKTNEIR